MPHACTPVCALVRGRGRGAVCMRVVSTPQYLLSLHPQALTAHVRAHRHSRTDCTAQWENQPTRRRVFRREPWAHLLLRGACESVAQPVVVAPVCAFVETIPSTKQQRQTNEARARGWGRWSTQLPMPREREWRAHERARTHACVCACRGLCRPGTLESDCAAHIRAHSERCGSCMPARAMYVRHSACLSAWGLWAGGVHLTGGMVRRNSPNRFCSSFLREGESQHKPSHQSHTHARTRARARMHTHARTRARVRTRMRTHARTRARVRTRIENNHTAGNTHRQQQASL